MAAPNQSSSPAQTSTRQPPQTPSHALAAHAANAMADKKASNITVIDLRDVSNMADFFVLGTGDSNLQVKAIANGVMDRIEEQCREEPWKREGFDHLQWVLLDYVDLVVHVFLPSKRDHYRLERLWGNADMETMPEDGNASDIGLLQDLLQQSPETS